MVATRSFAGRHPVLAASARVKKFYEAGLHVSQDALAHAAAMVIGHCCFTEARDQKSTFPNVSRGNRRTQRLGTLSVSIVVSVEEHTGSCVH